MSTIKADNFVWKTGESGGNTAFTATGSQIVYGVNKAWMNYNGVAPTISRSFNISSVSKSGTGSYTPSFTTSFPDIYYVFGGSVNMYTGGYISAVVQPPVPIISTSSVYLNAINYISGGTYYDASYFLVSFIR